MERMPSILPSLMMGKWRTRRVGHQAHAIRDGVVGAYDDRIAGHDVIHRGVFGGFAFQNDLPRVVAFRDDSEKCSVAQHRQSAYVFFSHHLDRLVNGGARFNGPNDRTFIAQERIDSSADFHGI